MLKKKIALISALVFLLTSIYVLADDSAMIKEKTDAEASISVSIEGIEETEEKDGDFISAYVDEISVSVNGEFVIFTDAQPFVDENDRTQIPVRALAETLGCEVQWRQEAQEVILTKAYKEADGIKAKLDDEYVCSKELHIFIGKTTYDGAYNTALKGKTEATGCIWQGEKTMDTAPVIVSDRTYLPARYVAEFFGYTVNWDGKTQTVIIND